MSWFPSDDAQWADTQNRIEEIRDRLNLNERPAMPSTTIPAARLIELQATLDRALNELPLDLASGSLWQALNGSRAIVRTYLISPLAYQEVQVTATES